VKKIIFTSIIAVGVLLSWQCIDPPAEPILPTWDTDISIPLANRVYLLEELVQKNPDLLGVDEYGVLVYSFSDTVVNTPFGDLIRLSPERADFSFDVGSYTLTPDDVEFEVSVADYLEVEHPYEGPSPGVAPVYLTGDIPEVESIQYMIIESGEARLTMRNETGMPVEIEDGLRIRNSDDGSEVAHFDYEGIIDPEETVTSAVDLEDIRVYRDMEYSFEFSSPSSDYVEIPDDPVLSFTLGFDDLEVSEAEARIPGQELAGSFNGEIVIDDSTFITEAWFSQGILNFTIENSIDLDIPFTISIPDLRSRDNPSQTYSISRTVPRGSEDAFSISLQEWMIQTSTVTNSLSYTVRLGTIEETGDFRTFNAADQLNGTINQNESSGDELIVEQIEGIIAPTEYAVFERVNLNIGEAADYFEGDITFSDVRLNLDLFFDGGYDALADIYIIGENKDGVRDSLMIPDDQRLIVAQDPSTIILDESNSTIAEFLSTFTPNLPDELIITGNLLVNPLYEPGYIDVTNKLQTSIHFDVPFDIGIRDGIVSDTLAIGEADDDIDRDIFDYINHGRMYFETDNGIPAGMDLRIQLLNGEGAVLRAFPLEGKPAIAIKSAPVNSVGFVNGTSGKDVRTLELTRDDIQMLRQADKSELLLGINTNNERETVKFTSQDSIRIKIYATFNVRADFN